MRINTRYHHLICLAVLPGLLIACNAVSEPATVAPPADNTRTVALADMSYIIRRGDILSDIALRLTGDLNNWRIIADYNHIANTRRLRVGEVLKIPQQLLVDPGPYVAPGNETQGSTHLRSSNMAIARVHSPGQTRTRTIPVAPVRLQGVNPNRTFSLQPLTPAHGDTGDSGAAEVRILGTYYPKGIYAEPATHSLLIDRVAPGSLFMVERILDGWFELRLDGQPAYLRRQDGELVRQ